MGQLLAIARSVPPEACQWAVGQARLTLRMVNRALKSPRGARAVDAFERAGAVEGVDALAGPARTGAQDRLDALREAVLVELGDLGEAERGAVARAAVLERPHQAAAAAHDASRGPRAGNVH